MVVIRQNSELVIEFYPAILGDFFASFLEAFGLPLIDWPVDIKLVLA